MKTWMFAIAAGLAVSGCATAGPAQAPLSARSSPQLQDGALAFRDLNRNGTLDVYEDWRRPTPARVEDLLARMTLEEKAGLLMHGNPPGIDGGLRTPWDLQALRPLIEQRHIRFFISRVGGSDPAALADMANAAQAMAEDSRLGIPVVISSDPRNHLQTTFGLNVDAGAFSQWPETTGMAAIGDPELVRRFGEAAGREYRAVGLRMALSPMADLASEPRWPRVSGTFGDDPALVSRLAGAYIEGFQGGRDGIGRDSVAAVVKHWVGYGAQPEGYDAHNPYGRYIAFPGGRFDDHLRAFDGAFAAHVAGVMPTYGQPSGELRIDGRPAEPVGAGFSRQMLQDLLRRDRRYGGIILTDWKITDDCLQPCLTGTLHHDEVGMPWGVENLSKAERFAKALDAGVDQFGGVADADIIVQLVRAGQVTEARVDESARRLLTLMFDLGLFENPYVDPEAARAIVGAPDIKAQAMDAQRRSVVLLENRDATLPLRPGLKVWLWKVSPDAARDAGFTVVDRPEDADVALVRVAAPFTTHPEFFFGSRHHEGALDFAADNPDRQAVERASAAVPTVVTAYLDRPAILGPVKARAAALLAEFGVSDTALFDVLTASTAPGAHLPFELPASMQAVEQQAPDAPSDSEAPLYPRGFGRTAW
jgi:beta-glucosidase